MTAPRAKIEASLAERGRPALWANEQESAVLAGFPADGVRFREALPELERAGFPPRTAFNGLRFIPAIERFCWGQVDSALPAPESLPSHIRPFEEIQNAGKRLSS